MKNLQLLYSRTATISLNNVEHHSYVERMFLANNNEVIGIDENDVEQIYPVVPAHEVIVGIQYLSMNKEICVATESGDVIVYNLHNKASESVTFCPGGLQAMAWTQCEDIVAFVTNDNKVVVMNCGYDSIAENELYDNAFGEEEFINVGWGNKETQFHGSAGKAAARKQPEQIQIDDVNQLDQRISIEWRFDDAFFVVSYVGAKGRMFKVFDKEGVLKSTSEVLAGLEAPIAWRPTGNWIAVPHILPNKYTIALFEKNGLRHREIVLPFKHTEQQVKQLAWSENSDILAVYTEHDDKSTIYLYTIGNYHWYQKQTLQYDGKCQVLRWATHDQGNVLHVAQNQQYHMYW